ncbi:hypothetical protein L0P88_13675 [Muricauda sp. SCSIO 64092]|uniref:hypothetical protein n=1 Tax=Allomuricauda sp. SCSIO 64092 TaxID=2908842 RepID=UPI001FF69BCD|nr:hypothetical protein [Muricauda sp. SCSIO 64092]UOY05001.1 hypothetical protein L0P88_13675 [Muricauda sp. SCSIO 64092]
MGKRSDLEKFANKQKAMDRAMWLNFEYRLTHQRFVMVPSYESGYFVVPNGHPSFEGEMIEELPNGYSGMTYMDIQNIMADTDPLPHWETIAGMVSVISGEILRFLLHGKVPLKRFIRYELACRGYNKENRWVGFEKAKEIWLK